MAMPRVTVLHLAGPAFAVVSQDSVGTARATHDGMTTFSVFVFDKGIRNDDLTGHGQGSWGIVRSESFTIEAADRKSAISKARKAAAALGFPKRKFSGNGNAEISPVR